MEKQSRADLLRDWCIYGITRGWTRTERVSSSCKQCHLSDGSCSRHVFVLRDPFWPKISLTLTLIPMLAMMWSHLCLRQVCRKDREMGPGMLSACLCPVAQWCPFFNFVLGRVSLSSQPTPRKKRKQEKQMPILVFLWKSTGRLMGMVICLKYSCGLALGRLQGPAGFLADAWKEARAPRAQHASPFGADGSGG